MEKYASASRAILRNPELSGKAKWIYCLLTTFCEGQERTCEPSTSELIELSGMSKNTYYKFIRELELNGIVKKYYEQSGPRPLDRTLHYRLCE